MLSEYSKELQILLHATAKRDCSNAFIFRDVTFFDFFKISPKNLSTKKFKKFELLTDEDTTFLSVYTQASQSLPLNINAQILLVSKIRRFFQFFLGKLRIPNPIVGCSQGLSVVANLAFKFLQRPIKFLR